MKGKGTARRKDRTEEADRQSETGGQESHREASRLVGPGLVDSVASKAGVTNGELASGDKDKVHS